MNPSSTFCLAHRFVKTLLSVLSLQPMFHEASKFVLTELQKEHQLAIKASAEAAARDVEGQQDDGPKTPVNYNGFTLHMSKCMARRVSCVECKVKCLVKFGECGSEFRVQKIEKTLFC